MTDRREDAMNAYAEHIKTLTDDYGFGYNGHERTLLIIGYGSGWDAALAAADAADGRVTVDPDDEETVKRVARAIHDHDLPDGDWCQLPSDDMWCDVARAVLAALKEKGEGR